MARKKADKKMVETIVESAETEAGSVEPQEPGVNGTAKPGANKAFKTRAGLYFQTPDVLRDKLEEAAAADGKTPQVWVRDYFAKMYGIELPPVATKTKYGSEEEKKAVQKAKREEKATLVKRLLAEYMARQEAAAKEAAEAVAENIAA